MALSCLQDDFTLHQLFDFVHLSLGKIKTGLFGECSIDYVRRATIFELIVMVPIVMQTSRDHTTHSFISKRRPILV